MAGRESTGHWYASRLLSRGAAAIAAGVRGTRSSAPAATLMAAGTVKLEPLFTYVNIIGIVAEAFRAIFDALGRVAGTWVQARGTPVMTAPGKRAALLAGAANPGRRPDLSRPITEIDRKPTLRTPTLQSKERACG